MFYLKEACNLIRKKHTQPHTHTHIHIHTYIHIQICIIIMNVKSFKSLLKYFK